MTMRKFLPWKEIGGYNKTQLLNTTTTIQDSKDGQKFRVYGMDFDGEIVWKKFWPAESVKASISKVGIWWN